MIFNWIRRNQSLIKHSSIDLESIEIDWGGTEYHVYVALEWIMKLQKILNNIFPTRGLMSRVSCSYFQEEMHVQRLPVIYDNHGPYVSGRRDNAYD